MAEVLYYIGGRLREEGELPQSHTAMQTQSLQGPQDAKPKFGSDLTARDGSVGCAEPPKRVLLKFSTSGYKSPRMEPRLLAESPLMACIQMTPQSLLWL